MSMLSPILEADLLQWHVNKVVAKSTTFLLKNFPCTVKKRVLEGRKLNDKKMEMKRQRRHYSRIQRCRFNGGLREMCIEV